MVANELKVKKNGATLNLMVSHSIAVQVAGALEREGFEVELNFLAGRRVHQDVKKAVDDARESMKFLTFAEA